MKTYKRLFTLVTVILVTVILASCSKTAENEHLPEYCRTYSGFMAFASSDLYNEVGGINRDNYLSVISRNELTLEAYDEFDEFDLNGIQCFQNLTSLSMEGKGFKDISPISALKNIQRISLTSTNVVNISSFRNLSKVNYLTISDTKTLQSVDGVEEMTKLTYLDLSDNGIVNIDGLNNLLNLNTLNLSNNEITYFPSINNLELLETLDVSNNNIIQLGDDLSGLRNLKNFIANDNQICDLSTLDDLTSLEELKLGFNDLGCNGISPDFSSLEGATNLTILELNDNNLTSISDLDGRDLPLEELLLQNNLLTDISPIRNFTELKRLDIYNNEIVNIDDLSGMANLTQIDLSDNLISDFSGLRTIPDLLKIDLSGNVITFIPDISSSWPSLIELDVSSNVITDTSGIEGHQNLQTLYLNDNGLTELSGLSDLPQLSELVMYQVVDDVLDPPEPEENPNLISIFTNSYNDTPLLNMDIDGLLTLGYTFGPGVEIYGSFNDNDDIEIINLSSSDVNVIDEFSFNLENLEAIYVQDNNITDISFILGNPNIRQIDLSDNPITNLTIIGGTLIDDLDNLEQVRALNISGDNELDGAFVDLPDLNFIDLTGTNLISISNSFNNLDEASTLRFSGENLQFIYNSFNDIFASSSSSNDITLLDGNLYSIIDSFNNGLYDSITIMDHTNITVNPTIISGSFNGITANNVDSIVITGNGFTTMSDSFNNVICDNLFLANNGTATMTNVFSNTDVGIRLNLQNNELENLDLTNILSVRSLDVSFNALTTVAFIDSISDLESVDISSQFNSDNTVATLTTIDGINNMTSLTDIDMTDIPVTSIDGFKNIGITEFSYDFTTNNDIYITSISPTSFSGSQITILDLGGHELDNIDFLSNFGLLVDLDISIDMADLSGLTGSVFEATLTNLELQSIQNVPSLAIFSGYDNVTDFSFDSPTTLTINDFDGLDALDSITFTQLDSITEFNDSFNGFASFQLTETYLEDFTALANINNSFDQYGLNGLSETVELSGLLTIVDSFNNVIELIVNNDTEIAPNFDSLSFDSMEDLTLTGPDYSGLAFIGNYSTLTTLTIEYLAYDITDINHVPLTQLNIQEMAPFVTSIDVTMNPASTLDITSDTGNTLLIDSNNNDFVFDLPNANVSITSSSSQLLISGESQDLTLQADSTTQVDFVSYSGGNADITGANLATVTSNASTGTNFTDFVIATSVAALDIDVRSLTVDITDTNLNDLTIDSPIADTTLSSTSSVLIIDATISELLLDYPELESVTTSGIIGTLDIQATNVDVLALGSTVIASLTVTTTPSVIDYQGTNIADVVISNNVATNSTLVFPNATLSISNSIAAPTVFTVEADDVTLSALNTTSITFGNTTDVNSIYFFSGSGLTNATYGTSTVDSTTFLGTNSTFVISGTHTMDINVISGALDDLTINAPSSDFNVSTDVVSLNANIQANNIEMDGLSNITDITLDTTSSMNNLTITNSLLLSDFTLNNATINLLTTSSSDTNFVFDGPNVSSLNLSGDNFISLEVEVSDTFTLNTASSGSISADLVADEVIFNSDATIISLDNNSVITEVTIDSDNLTILLFGNADVALATVTTISDTLTTSGTQVDTVNINGTLSNVNATFPLLSTLSVDVNATTPLTVDTTTQDITITSNNDLLVDSSTLVSATINNASNNVTLEIDKVALDFELSGTMGDVFIDEPSLETLTFGTSTVMTSLQLDNSNVVGINAFLITLPSLSVTSDVTTFSVTGGNSLNTVDLDMINLTTLTTSTLGTDFVVNSNETALTIQGSVVDTLTVTALNMSSLNLVSGAGTLQIVSNNLGTLDTNNTVDTLILNSPVNNFNLKSSASSITHNTTASNVLNFDPETGASNLVTEANTINIIDGYQDLNITGDNINSITGVLDTLVLDGSLGSGAINLNVDATYIEISNNDISSVFLTGTRTVGTLDITSNNVTTIATNEVVVSNLDVQVTANSLNVDSRAARIETNGSTINEITFNIKNDNTRVFTDTVDLTFNTTNSSDVLITLDALAETTIDINNLDIVNVVIEGNEIINIESNANEILVVANEVTELNILGTNTSASIVAAALTDLSTALFVVNDTFELQAPNIDTLEFVSIQLLGSVDTLIVESLLRSDENVENTIDLLRDSTITLQSPITLLDVYNYYYDIKEAELTVQEALDTVRFDTYYDIEHDEALAVFRANSYFDYLTNTSLNDEIDAQVYQTADEYLDGYAVSLGYEDQQEMIDDTVNYGQTAVNNIRVSIQNTLDNAELIIDTNAIDVQVTADIATDTDIYAQNERDSIGFTIE